MTPTNSPYDSGSDATAELLRQALSVEAADVQPSPDALRSIQQRTHSTRSTDSSGRERRFHSGSTRTNFGGRPSWVLGALGAAAATAAVITAVVVIGDQGADPSRTPAADPGTTAASTGSTTDGSASPASPSDTTASATPATMHPGVYDPKAPAANQVTMYYLGESDHLQPTRLYPEPHTLRSSSEPRMVAAVREFLTSRPMDPYYSNGWPAGVDVQSVSEDNGLTTIALTGVENLRVNGAVSTTAWPEGGSPVKALLASAGITGEVQFTYNGERVGSFALLGEIVPEGMRLPPEADWRAWVSVTSPADGQTVDSPVTVMGSANVFEANVNWELLDANGKIVDSDYTMAGFMEWRDFTVELGDLEPGTYTIRAFESSAEDGKPTKVDDKTFTVR